MDVSVHRISSKPVKSSHEGYKPIPGRFKFRIILDHQCRPGRRVFRKRLFPQEFSLEHPADRLAEQGLLHRDVAGRHLKCTSSVLHHLRGRHLSPLPFAVLVQTLKPFEDLAVCIAVEKGFHTPVF